MRIQRVQNNNYNNPNFRALIFDKNMKPILEDISPRELLIIREIGEKLKDTKYYDLQINSEYLGQRLVQNIFPSFIPKSKDGVKLVGIAGAYSTSLLHGDNGYKTILRWKDSSGSKTLFDFESSEDANKAKEIADKADIDVHTHDNAYRRSPMNILSALHAWTNVCLEVLEKSMAFKESGKPKVLTISEKMIEDLMSTKKDEISPETINTLRNYFKNNSDYGNLYTADDMLELLKDMFAEDILYKKDILTTPIKEGDSSILMYIADIFPTEENAKKYDKIISILKKVQGINYNFRDKSNTSFLEKVMMSENFKLLDLIKNEPLEYYPELEYAYENIQNPEFKEKIKELNIILKDTDGLTANDVKSELQSIAFQNTVNRKVQDANFRNK